MILQQLHIYTLRDIYSISNLSVSLSTSLNTTMRKKSILSFIAKFVTAYFFECAFRKEELRSMHRKFLLI